MIRRIEVIKKKNERDVLAESLRRDIEEFFGFRINSIRTAKVYTINAELSEEEFSILLKDLFIDSITEEKVCYEKIDFDWLIEIGFKPGVKDNIGDTCKNHGIKDVIKRNLKEGESVHSSKQFYIKGNLKRGDVEKIANELLANKIIEEIYIFRRDEVLKKGVSIPLPIVFSNKKERVETYDLRKFSDEELIKLSNERLLALNLDEMLLIKEYFSNEKFLKERKKVGLSSITDVELEAIAQTWSDHCKHKRFNAKIHYFENGKEEIIDSLFKTYIKEPSLKIGKKFPWLLSAFNDNAGIVALNDKILIADKIETHNAPSALEPYGGAITGILGVNRDILGAGLGAKPMINVFAFCFGNLNLKNLPKEILHPRRIREGVHKGVIDGGNQSGIPLGRGREIFEEKYAFRPLVYCGTIGVMPRKIHDRETHKKKANPGDFIVMVGGRIGKDGIHGATFSSGALHKGSPVQAVQIADTITQKMMLDFLLEARDKLLYNCITDNGAGGLSSSVGEMAIYSNGCEIELEKAPLKYHGLDPWEILLSESQERMTLAVSKEKIGEFLKLANKRDVEATVIGKFTNSGKFHVKYKGKSVAYLDLEFLHSAKKMQLKAVWKERELSEPKFQMPDIEKTLEEILKRPNICSKEDKLRQYDHEVKALTVIKPLIGKESDVESDASVFCLEYNNYEGIAIAEGINPYYSEIDTYHMAQSVADEALRRVIAVGAKLPDRKNFLYGIDNFCWNIYDDFGEEAQYSYAQLVRANKGLCDYYTKMNFPLISGKDSMRNVYKTENKIMRILPTLLVSIRAKIKDIRKCVTMDVKAPGDLLYILGETFNELGASEYYRYIGEKNTGKAYIGKNVPKVNLKAAKRLYKALSKAISKGLVNSAHTITLGGLGVALAKISFAGGYGLDVDLRKVPCSGIEREDQLLFSESNSRFLVTISKEKKGKFSKILKGNVFSEIGIVTKRKILKIKGFNGNYIVNTNIEKLKEIWKKSL
ncbi:MAG: AIR synthase-related protein [Candidatus Altiarchaeota archaeon]